MIETSKLQRWTSGCNIFLCRFYILSSYQLVADFSSTTSLYAADKALPFLLRLTAMFNLNIALIHPSCGRRGSGMTFDRDLKHRKQRIATSWTEHPLPSPLGTLQSLAWVARISEGGVITVLLTCVDGGITVVTPTRRERELTSNFTRTFNAVRKHLFYMIKTFF